MPDAPEDESQELSATDSRSELPTHHIRPMVPDITARTTSRGLPQRQPIRALTVLLGYLVTTGAAVGPLQLAFGGALGGALSIAWACLLTVPVAILAPRPTQTPETPSEVGIPVLKRHSAPPSETAPSPWQPGGP